MRVPSFAKWTLLIVYCVVACAYQSPCFSCLREFWSCLIGGLTEQRLGDARRYWGRGKVASKLEHRMKPCNQHSCEPTWQQSVKKKFPKPTMSPTKNTQLPWCPYFYVSLSLAFSLLHKKMSSKSQSQLKDIKSSCSMNYKFSTGSSRGRFALKGNQSGLSLWVPW